MIIDEAGVRVRRLRVRDCKFSGIDSRKVLSNMSGGILVDSCTYLTILLYGTKLSCGVPKS